MTRPSAPLKPVYVTSVACSAIGAAYGLLGIRPSPLPVVFIVVAPLVSVVLRVQNDAPFYRFSTIQDFGLFVYLLWPILVPWYVIRTRGAHAWSLALLLLGVVVAPLVVTLFAAFLHDVATYVATHYHGT
jgi:hypothetical protein